MSRALRLVAAVALSVAMATSAASADSAEAGPPAAAPPGDSGPGTAVTLITGDRVIVRESAQGDQAVTIQPARWPGRRARFQTWSASGALHVVPTDVAHLVPHVLDPALFDVSGLLDMGFADAAVDALPLIVQHDPGQRAAARTPTRVTRELPSIGATAVDLPHGEAGRFGAELAAMRRGPATLSVARRIWLDAKARASRLDVNLRQIAAPAAWATGLSGAGVRVAVLDTGVDATHPDLSGQVADEQDFTGGGSTVDRNGHGTHVASLVAGTGAAAAGARRGVAFGADLLSGKVLNDEGQGLFSWIIAGMEWAAGQRARVVNMSLGTGTPSTGQDPLSLAVNELSASTGTLFVVSSGNTGPRAMSVGAPGAADAALTVGAVDRRDSVAPFSSRGPRLRDHAVKPDLAAPGVDVVAARAAGTDLGRPVGTHYTRLSGTSMAAPHVAGAAALLAERRTDWDGARLKAALMGSAAATPGSVYDRGAGRLDVARAVGQQVLADTPVLSFGLVPYPQSDLPPIQKWFALVNTAGNAMTVDLSASLRSPDGRPAPRGMLAVSPPRLVIPAHGTAAVSVTLAPALGGFGPFSGDVAVSSSGAPVLRVPVGVVKESTHHIVTLRALDRNGTSNVETLVTVINLQDVSAPPTDPIFMSGGEATMRVPPGFYTITAAILTLEEGDPPPDDAATSAATDALVVTSVAVATRAEQAITGDTAIVLDARDAQPISAGVAGVSTVPVDLHLFVAVKDRRGGTMVLGYTASAQDVIDGILFVQPTEPARHGRLELSSKWRLDTDGGGPTYDLLFNGPQFPASLRYSVDPRTLAGVRTTYRAPLTPVGYRELRQVFTDVNPVSVAVQQPVPGLAPLLRTEYVTAAASQRWFQCAWLVVAEAAVGDFCEAPTGYRPRTTTDHAWLRAPLRTAVGVERAPTTLLIGMSDLAEDAPHSGSIGSFVLAERSYRLFRDGGLIAQGADPLGVHQVPGGQAVFRLERSIELSPGVLPLSTRVDSSWTFVSAPPGKRQVAVTPPVLIVAPHVPVDDANQVAGDRPAILELETAHITTRAPRVTQVSLSLSVDDGRTWQVLRLDRAGGQRYRAVVPAGTLPAGVLVSLRATAQDAGGGQAEQTIIRAFAVAAPT